MAGCLDGVRVLEFARFQAGPKAGLVLSDLGAEVIKIESPGGEHTRHWTPQVRGQSVYFTVYNRGKKSMVIDLGRPEGLAVARDLVKTADIVLENFKPGTMKRLGLGYEALCSLKPDIIFMSVSGFGQQGPYRDEPGFDTIGQAMSGLMHLTGHGQQGPIVTAFSVCDRTTALHATIGMLAALRHRDKTGEGQWIDVCLLDAGYTMVEIPASYYLETGNEDGEPGRISYPTKDGWIVIMAATEQMTQALVDIIGVTLDADAPPGPFRLEADPKAKAALQAWCLKRTMDEVWSTLKGAGIVAAPVRTVAQATRDSHFKARELMVKVPDAIAGDIYAPGLAIKFSKTPGAVGPVPVPGANTEEILRQLPGYDDDRISRLRSSGVIAGPPMGQA